MLTVTGLATFRRRVHILKGVEFTVNQGELVAIVGPNGAGKSTLMGTLMGFYPPNQGAIIYKGEDITRLSVEEKVRAGITLIPERRQIFNGFSVIDNLFLGSYSWNSRQTKKLYDNELEMVFNIFPILKEKSKDMAGSLSGGQQQMLAIGRALMAKPRLILLDEPTLGLAPLVIKDILERLKTLCDLGATILLAEQNAKAAFKVADRIYVLELGQVVFESTPEEAVKDQRVRQAYLGA